MLESVAEFMERRRREIAEQGRDAVAAAHDAYGRAVRTSKELVLKTSDDVARYGVQLVSGGRTPAPRPKPIGTKASPTDNLRPAAKPPRIPPPASKPLQRQEGGWRQSDLVKSIGGNLAGRAGNAIGIVAGAADAAEGLIDGALFLSRLVDPIDAWKSRPGQSARAQLAAQLLEVGHEGFNYAKKAVADPAIVARDVRNNVHQIRVDLDPSATPTASTLGGELQRNFAIGKNQGELAFDVGSLMVGGPAAKAASKLGAANRAAVGAEKFVAQGFSPSGAAYLAKPYVGMGHHNFPRRSRLPEILGGGPLPPKINDGPFNVLHPDGITRGDFYALHSQVDPHFYGAKLPARVGGERWSSKKLGIEKYTGAERIWHSMPAPLKARIGGLSASAGSLSYDLSEENRP